MKGKDNNRQARGQEEKKMTEIIVKVYDSVEAEHETRNLRKLGYERTQNAFWVEHWKKGDHLVILERDF